ncbi:cell division protein FtsA [Buchnera aphidicola]|uniref:cell division protein FtsA n=1 Tax=Buchnera aphidicola TaxID=9 RepID=UPI003463B502
MIKKKNKKLIVGLEIGSTKIVVLVGELLINNVINIVGIGQCPATGIDQGNIKNLESVILCIKTAIYEAETMAECNISNVYLSLSNKYFKCKNEIGIVPINNNEVTKIDVDRAIHTARSIKLKNDYSILHIIPQEYLIDQETGIKNPIGLSGFRMAAKVHLITYKKKIKKNLIKAVKKCNLKVKNIIFSGIASSTAILTAEEKQSGVCMVDIGGCNITIIIYINGYIHHTQVIPYAGNTVTNDIAYALNTTFQNAEIIKKKYGSTISSSLSTTKIIEISNNYGINSKNIQKNILKKIIEARYEELFNIINNIINNIQNKLYENKQKYMLDSGIVLTGGGSKTKSLKIFAKKIFNMPVRIGYPKNITTYNDQILKPQYSGAIGLIQYGSKLYHHKNQNSKKKSLKKWLCNFQRWIQRILYNQ